MSLNGTLADVRYRRSKLGDAAALSRLVALGDIVSEGLPAPSVFHISTAANFAHLIECASVCVTAVRGVSVAAAADGGRTFEPDEVEGVNKKASGDAKKEEEVVVGFISLDDLPPPQQHVQSGAAREPSDGDNGHTDLTGRCMDAWNATERIGSVESVAATRQNSAWLRMLLAPPSSTFKDIAAAKAAAAAKSASYTAQAFATDLLRVVLGTLSAMEHVFVASADAGFPLLNALPGVAALVDASGTASASTMAWHVPRGAVFSPLTLRPGRLEDYDDVVSLLVTGGRGIITDLPDAFYLEELLQDQDQQHKVVVAEDSATHSVVGLACVRQVSQEEEMQLARQYNTDMLERLKPLKVERLGSGRAKRHEEDPGGSASSLSAPSGTASIFFLYFNPCFDHSAYQLLPHLFREFPGCDYLTLQLTHTPPPPPEPLVLEKFQYMPLRRYQPHNVRGELVRPPEALWVCPRVSLEAAMHLHAQVVCVSDPANATTRQATLSQFAAARATPPAGSGVHAVLRHQQQSRGGASAGGGLTTTGTGAAASTGASVYNPGCSLELIAALRDDLPPDGTPDRVSSPSSSPRNAVAGLSAREDSDASAGLSSDRSPLVFALTYGPLPSSTSSEHNAKANIVGVVSAQRVDVGEVYALRANYALDRFLAFNTTAGFDYTATDISLATHEGPLRYRSAEHPSLLVRFAYVRPAFRQHVKFFLREVLRQTKADTLLNLTSADAALCQTVLPIFTFVPPRRVVEGAATAAACGEEDHVDMDAKSGLCAIPQVNDVSVTLTDAANKKTTSFFTPQGSGQPHQPHPVVDVMWALSSLSVTTRRLLSDERIRAHARIVVVGASATALCTLYELLCVPYVEYLNLTLITMDGMPPHPNQEWSRSGSARPRQERWQADMMELLEREHMRLCLGDGLSLAATINIGSSVIRIVQETLVDINTGLKFVQLENNVYEPYDYLLLATGQQYIVPPAIRTLQKQEGNGARGGVLALSGAMTENRLRNALAELNQASTTSITNVVVYGSGLDAIATLSTMISVGFPVQRLVLCRPQPDTSQDSVAAAAGGVFADAACGEATLALFRALGVTVLDGYGVSHLEFDDDVLSSVLLASLSYERKAGDAVELPCSLLVCLEDKDIDRNVLSALTKRSIVFDGRVIVSATYETSQPDVFAAGPVAMFTRRYGATEPFETFHARDVGRDVAHVLLGRLGVQEFVRRDREGEESLVDPKVASTPSASSPSPSTPSRVLPVYPSPVSRRVHLPCGYQYFSAVRGAAGFAAEACVRLDFASADMLQVTVDDVRDESEPALLASPMSDDRGAVMPPVQTAAAAAAGHAVREMVVVYLHKRDRTIDGIVYVGNGQPAVHNYRALIGLPESLFHLEFRFTEARKAHGADGAAVNGSTGGSNGLDLVAYLKLPLFLPFLSDRFRTFFTRLREEMQAADEVVAARRRLLKERQANGSLTPAAAAAHLAELTDVKQGLRHKVQLALLTHLHESKDARPQTMFLPSIEREVAAGRRAA